MKMKRFARVSPTAAIAFDLYVVTAVHRAAKILFPKQINIRPNHEQIDFRPELISSLSRLNVEPSRNSQCTIEFRAQQNPLQCNGLALWTAACAAPCTAPLPDFGTALPAQHPRHCTLDSSLHSTLHSTLAKLRHTNNASQQPQQPAQHAAQHLCQTSPPHSGQQPETLPPHRRTALWTACTATAHNRTLDSSLHSSLHSTFARLRHKVRHGRPDL